METGLDRFAAYSGQIVTLGPNSASLSFNRVMTFKDIESRRLAHAEGDLYLNEKTAFEGLLFRYHRRRKYHKCAFLSSSFNLVELSVNIFLPKRITETLRSCTHTLVSRLLSIRLSYSAVIRDLFILHCAAK